jgi:DNA-binding NarL/FixJ family response regulator
MPSDYHHSPDDRCRPPLFKPEEWRRMIAAAGLSPRHAEVVGLVIQSKKDKQIGRMLGIRPATVRVHLKECRRRLHAVDRISLFYRVVEIFRRLFDPPSA